MRRREVSLQCRLPRYPIDRAALVEFALDVMGRLDLEGSVGVRIMADRSMAELNRKFLGRKGATDVISFPSGDEEETGLVYLGDIAVGGRVASRAAQEAGIPLEKELRRLILHGLLHLVGYDHETDRGRMKRKESGLRREFGMEP